MRSQKVSLKYLFPLVIVGLITLVLSYKAYRMIPGAEEVTSEEIPVVITEEYHVKKGDTIKKIFLDAEIDFSIQEQVIPEICNFLPANRLSSKNKFTFTFTTTESGAFKELESGKITISPTRYIELVKDVSGSFLVEERVRDFKRSLVRVNSDIKSSLFQTASHLKLPMNPLNDLVKALSYDIDFQRDIQLGSKLEVLFERFYDQDGNFSHNGNILFANLDIVSRSLSIYRYTDSKGNTDYYDKTGTSLRKDLLRTPVPAARISSKFGSRKHPILGYTKMHKGVDFAAPIGTPIYSAGKGYISEIGRKGGYGNYIRIRHNGEISTAYGHISKFASNLRKGTFVKQGQVIAYVGSTGNSTGPHLHFEVLQRNVQINPMSMKLQPGTKLPQIELNRFKNYINELAIIESELDSKKEIAYETISEKIKQQLR